MNPKILVGVVDVGYSKSYAMAKLNECLTACIEGVPGVEIEWFGAKHPRYLSHQLPPVNLAWADEIVFEGKEAMRRRTLSGGFDYMLMQGVDCWWQSRKNFEFFLESALDVPICGALTVGRMAPDYPVVRRWRENKNGLQIDVDRSEIDWERSQGNLIPCGFPGSEAMTVRRDVLVDIPIKNPNYEMWFNRQALPDVARLCVEEFFCWQADKKGYRIFCDPLCPTWHCNDTGVAHTYDRTNVPMEEILW